MDRAKLDAVIAGTAAYSKRLDALAARVDAVPGDQLKDKYAADLREQMEKARALSKQAEAASQRAKDATSHLVAKAAHEQAREQYPKHLGGVQRAQHAAAARLHAKEATRLK